MSQNKVAIFGLGRMGKVHLEAALGLGLEIIAVCDIREEIRAELQIFQGLNKTRFYSDPSDLIVNESFDIAIVATTTLERYKILMQLLGYKNHLKILSEKPLVSKSSELGKLARVMDESSNKSFYVNHQMRFMDQYSQVKSVIQEQTIGKFRGMIVAASNIGLGMNVTHYFDAFRWLTQDDDIVLQSKIEDKEIESPRGLAYGDYAGWVLAINSLGQRLYVDFSSDVGHGIVCIYQFDRGKIMINELEATMELYSRLAEYSDSPSHRYGLPAFSIIKKIRSSSLIELSQKVILEMMGEADLPTLHDGIVNTSLALSCIHSSANFSKPVHWKDVLDLDLVTKWA